MLERLEVRGLGIIDRLDLEFGEGLTVLSGETGAGKSLLVESLKLLSGARASTELIRSGEKKLRVEGFFSPSTDPVLDGLLEELGVEQGGELVIRREILASGRSRSWINDHAVTAGALGRISSFLLAIHGQHEQFGLGLPEIQRRLVDEFGGLGNLKESLGKAWREYSAAEAAFHELKRARSGRRDRLDAIRYQLAEIEGCAPRAGEDAELRELRRRLSHAGRIRELSGAVLDSLGDRDSSVIEELAKAGRAVGEMAELGMDVSAVSEQLDAALLAAEEALLTLRPLAESIHEDPGELDRVEERLHRIENLMLKYGGSLEEVLDHRDRLVLEKESLEGVEERLGEAREVVGRCLGTYDQCARELQEAREKAGRELAGELVGILDRLGMEGSRIDPQIPLSETERGFPSGSFGSEIDFRVVLDGRPGTPLRGWRESGE